MNHNPIHQSIQALRIEADPAPQRHEFGGKDSTFRFGREPQVGQAAGEKEQMGQQVRP
jgi:hypothetical protein